MTLVGSPPRLLEQLDATVSLGICLGRLRVDGRGRAHEPEEKKMQDALFVPSVVYYNYVG